jgi:hypothetical protein
VRGIEGQLYSRPRCTCWGLVLVCVLGGGRRGRGGGGGGGWGGAFLLCVGLFGLLVLWTRRGPVCVVCVCVCVCVCLWGRRKWGMDVREGWEISEKRAGRMRAVLLCDDCVCVCVSLCV